jgi:catechol 2,3-dioxygenase-like lactoylglutathione lyase family enzyme
MRMHVVSVGRILRSGAISNLLVALASCAAQEPEPRAAAALPAACEAPDSAGPRLDHVPIAVRDLEAARRDYAALGFSFKPGRAHPNSIDNLHVKFADGSALELITATEPRDELARHYLSFLAEGEGGAFLSLDGGEVGPVSEAIRLLEPDHRTTVGSYYESLSFPTGHDLKYLFFILIRSRPPDLPEHLAHANTARRLAAVWLRRADPAREVRLLERLGARACPSALALPAGAVRTEVRTGGGGVYLLHAPGAAAHRAIAGLTVEVASLDAARRAVLLPDSALHRGRDARGEWLRVPPAHARGLWLELLQPEP